MTKHLRDFRRGYEAVKLDMHSAIYPLTADQEGPVIGNRAATHSQMRHRVTSTGSGTGT